MKTVKEIDRSLKKGLSYREIARRLEISHKAVGSVAKKLKFQSPEKIVAGAKRRRSAVRKRDWKIEKQEGHYAVVRRILLSSSNLTTFKNSIESAFDDSFSQETISKFLGRYKAGLFAGFAEAAGISCVLTAFVFVIVTALHNYFTLPEIFLWLVYGVLVTRLFVINRRLGNAAYRLLIHMKNQKLYSRSELKSLASEGINYNIDHLWYLAKGRYADGAHTHDFRKAGVARLVHKIVTYIGFGSIVAAVCLDKGFGYVLLTDLRSSQCQKKHAAPEKYTRWKDKSEGLT